MLELDDGFKTVDPSRLEFHVASADVTDGDYIPDNDMNLRLEHHFIDPTDGSKQVIYLHNSEKRKPETTVSVHSTAAATATAAAAGGNSASLRGGGGGGSVIARSFRLVFSSVRSAQDIFKLMRVGKPEQATIGLVKALRRSCNLYSFALKNPRVAAASDDDVKRLVKAILLAIIDLQHRGTSSHPDIDCTCHRHPIESKRISNHIPCKKNRDQEGKWHDACGVQQSLRRIAGQFCSAHLSRHEINGRGF